MIQVISIQNLAPHPKKRGFILATVVVFGAVFLTIALGMAGYLLTMQRSEQAHVEHEAAFAIAEAGLNYYAWHLAHFPTDLQDGTGGQGPYEHEYRDPENDIAGSFSLEIDGNVQCGVLGAIGIESTGWTARNPNRSATVLARYARPSVAEYGVIANAIFKVNPNRVIQGRVHSNYGVRMDGDNLSTVESAVSSWVCTSPYGCSPDTTVPGVFGTGTHPEWWQYPVPSMDFGAITGNMADIETAAQTGGGRYFGPLEGDQNQRGYRAVLKDNGTVDVYQVTGTEAVTSGVYTTEWVWGPEYNIIASETFLGNYTIPSSCTVLFFDSRLWLEGVVKGIITIGASGDIMTPNSIVYADSGLNGLTAITQSNIIMPLTVPNDLILSGVFVAQEGHLVRHYYVNGYPGYSVPSVYSSFVLRNSLTTIGSIVSNKMPVTVITSGGVPVSGFVNNHSVYDGRIAKNPPPFTPYISPEYRFITWRQF